MTNILSPIRILHLEDDPADAELVREALSSGNLTFEISCVQTREGFVRELEKGGYDIILSDYKLPMFNGIAAMKITQEHSPGTPFIIVSGAMGEDAAIETLTRGATDYVLKRKLTRIVPAVKRAIEEQKNRNESIRIEKMMQVRLHILETVYTKDFSLDETCTLVLDEIESLTGSKIGFYHFIEEDQKTISLQSWSTNTVKTMCSAEGKGSHYDISEGGVWTEYLHAREPVIHNDYSSLPKRKGLPEGHALVIRKLVIPIIRGDSQVACLGVGNKPTDYDETDVQIVSLLADFSWEIIKRKRAEIAIKESEERILRERENFYKILETAPVGLLLINDRMIIKQANRTIASLVHRDPGEIIGKQAGNGLGCIHSLEDSRECGLSVSCPNCSYMQELEKIFSEWKSIHGKEFFFTLLFNGKPQKRWFNVNIEPFEINDIKYIIVAMDDITQKKELEQENLANLQFLEGLDRISRAIQGTHDLDKMMGNVLDEVINIFDSDRTYILYPCDPEAPSWSIHMERTKPEYPGAGSQGKDIPMDPVISKKLQMILESDGPVKFTPELKDPQSLKIFSKYNLKSFISMALYPVNSKPWEFGLHQCSYERIWTAEEERLFYEIGRRLEGSLNTLLMYREIQTLLRELYHRTKNNMAVIVSLLEIQSQYYNDKNLHPILVDAQNRIRSMALVHQKLYEAKELSRINLKYYINDLITILMSSFNLSSNRISLTMEMDDVFVDIDYAVPCGLILNELITNSLKYAFPGDRKGVIKIKLQRTENEEVMFSVEDDGIGVPEGFLFKEKRRMGIEIIHGLTESQLKGDVKFESTRGVKCRVVFSDTLYRKRI